MNFRLKHLLACLAVGYLCCGLNVVDGFARAALPTDDPADTADESDQGTTPRELAAQVREIAGSSLISRAKKEKRISTAVRVAVVSATAYRKDPREILGVALALTEAAARAAPQFAEVIANSASFASAVSRIDGAPGRIRTAAYAAAKNPRLTAKAKPARKPRPKPVPEPETITEAPETVEEEMPPAPVRSRRPVRQEHLEALPNNDEVADSSKMNAEESSPWPKIMLGESTTLDLTASVGIRHDDNIFVTADNKVGDMIYTVTPGAAFRFGLNSLAHGSLNYNEAFVRYAGSKAPNVSLGAGAADFGYDNGSLILGGTAVFQQLNQNDSAVSSLGQQKIFRRDVLTVTASAETEITAKTRIKSGVNFDRTQYKTDGLIGTQETSVPLKVYFETTPKTSVSVGATYRKVTPQGDGPSGHDIYYNVGARGNFTAKLSGEFSVGYRSRDVGVNPAENLWGFDGNLNYELTPKTSLGLLFSRDFSTGALGESLKNDRFALKLSTDPTAQWTFSASVSYANSGYGPTVYSVVNVPVTTERTDRYWEGEMSASYIFTHWLSLTADYTIRNNHSTLPGAVYSNNLFSLMLTFRY